MIKNLNFPEIVKKFFFIVFDYALLI